MAERVDIQIDPELLSEFVAEAKEHLETVEPNLLHLEEHPEDIECVNALFRAIHSIKGAAGFLGLEQIEQLSHAMETLLDEVRRGKRGVSPELLDILLEGVDALRALIDGLCGGQNDVDTTSLVDRLQNFSEGASSTISAGKAVEWDKIAADALPQIEMTLVELMEGLDEDKLNALKESLLSLNEIAPADKKETITSMISAIEGLSGDAADAATIAELLNKVDALKEPSQEKEEPTVQVDEEELQIFLKAAYQHLDAEELALEELRRDAKSGEAIDTFLRAAKSLSNAAGFLGFADIKDITSEQEEKLVAAKDRGKALEDDEINTLHKLYQALRDKIEALEKGKKSDADKEDEGKAQANVPKEVSAQKGKPAIGQQKMMRVPEEKIDELMNLIGELIIAKNTFLDIARAVENEFMGHRLVGTVRQATLSLDRICSELQVNIMDVRMVPMKTVFQRFPRLVRDLTRKAGKQVELIMEGEETEVDKTIAENLVDPLTHLVRNAIDHGIEEPEMRVKLGKPECGRLHLRSFIEGNRIIVEVIDDGKGIDPEKIREKAISKGFLTPEEAERLTKEEVLNLIFTPGFSTAEKITDVSGRGVGMDVVKTNISKLNGTVQVESEIGKGTCIRLELPPTLAVFRALFFKVEDGLYAVPADTIREVARIGEADVKYVGHNPVFILRGEVVPLVFMEEIVGEGKKVWSNSRPVLVIRGKTFGIVVDEIRYQRDIALKQLGSLLGKGGIFAGATIMEDGSVVLVLEPDKLIHYRGKSGLSSDRMENGGGIKNGGYKDTYGR